MQEWVLLLREVAWLFPELPGMEELQPFLSSPRGSKDSVSRLDGAAGSPAQAGRSGRQDEGGEAGDAAGEKSKQQRRESGGNSVLDLEGDAGLDLEADVFHNLVHLQVHRRTRALFKCRNLLLSPGLHCSPVRQHRISCPPSAARP